MKMSIEKNDPDSIQLTHFDDMLDEEALAEDLDESFEQFWSDYTNEDIELLRREMLEEELRRFESSLSEAQLVELDHRIQVNLTHFVNGTIPGFEGIGEPGDREFLLSPAETLSDRDREFRDHLLKDLRRSSLREMKIEADKNKAIQSMDVEG